MDMTGIKVASKRIAGLQRDLADMTEARNAAVGVAAERARYIVELEAEAATLREAANDLLAVCKLAVGGMERLGVRGTPLYEKLAATIAKAEGEVR